MHILLNIIEFLIEYLVLSLFGDHLFCYPLRVQQIVPLGNDSQMPFSGPSKPTYQPDDLLIRAKVIGRLTLAPGSKKGRRLSISVER